jgi:hypothetical protein
MEAQVMLNRAREYSTVHGDRPPGDLHANVHFYQEGLPFDAHGVLVADHPDLTADTPAAKKLQALVERKKAKASKGKKKTDPAETGPAHPVGPHGALPPDHDPAAVDTENDEEDDEADEAPIDLRKWLIGEQEVAWMLVSNAIALKYKRRVNNKKDAVEFLVSQGVVSRNQLTPAFQKFLG